MIFFSHFVRHMGVGGRGAQLFFGFCYNAQSFCIFLSDFMISSVIL
jgi:hypothetical protein